MSMITVAMAEAMSEYDLPKPVPGTLAFPLVLKAKLVKHAQFVFKLGFIAATGCWVLCFTFLRKGGNILFIGKLHVSAVGLFITAIMLIPFSSANAQEVPMVEVPGGEFKSGPDLKPVNVKAFSIDKYEVTNAEYKKVVPDHAIPAGKENHPVVEISYFEAEKYCKALGKRIPTDLEWEKAARGNDGRLYPWGADFDSSKANTVESGIGGTTPVGSYKNGQSPYGAMDMTGNVWEWVDAWSGDDQKYRYMMGGSFFDDKHKSTVFSTLKSIPDDIHTFSGFRCAK